MSKTWILVRHSDGREAVVHDNHIAHDPAWQKVCEMTRVEEAAPQPGLSPLQEPKYTTDGYRIINRFNGLAIAADEPVFIFRARDKHAAGVLGDYAARCKDIAHQAAVNERFMQFSRFAERHPERMIEPGRSKEPDDMRWAPGEKP